MRPHHWLPLLLLTACGARGAMGQASLIQECDAGDPGCRRPAPTAPLAVGARLRPDVHVDVAGSVMPVVALTSSRPDVIAIEDGALVGHAPGMAVVLIATPGGTVIDFQHVWVAAPTDLVIERASPEGGGAEEIVGPLELAAGEQVFLRSTMVSGGQRLAGDAEPTWQLEGEGVALLRDGATGRRRLLARGPGRARIVVASLGVSATVDVEVVP